MRVCVHASVCPLLSSERTLKVSSRELKKGSRCKQAGKEAGRQSGRQASGQAGGRASKQASTMNAFSWSHALEGLA